MARFRFRWPVFIPVMTLVLFCPAARAADVSFPRNSVAFVVAAPRTPLESRALIQLTDYLTRVLKKPPNLVSSLTETPVDGHVILLVNGQSPVLLPVASPPDSPEGYALGTLEAQGRKIVAAVGTTDQGLKRAVQRLIIDSRQEPDGLVFPETPRTGRPWMPQREWTVCPWAPRNVRGVFFNPHADLRMDIGRYSEQQLADYAAMFDWFGYNGCQLMETAYSYAAFGSIEAFQDWQRRLAGAVRNNGQAVSLWVWAAQFSGFDWYDPQVVSLSVPAKGAFDDAATRRVFEKYYDSYARLAPLTDRLIGHFYDPGVLTDRSCGRV